MKKQQDLIKLGLSFFIFFFTAPVFVLILMYVLKFDVSNVSNREYALMDLLISLIMTIAYALIYRKLIKTSIQDTKERCGNKFTKFLLAIIIGYLVLNGVQIVATGIESMLFAITGVTSDTANNQQTIEELLKVAPLMMITSACFLAPIEEELLFRGAIGNAIKNKKVFITVSGLIFGLVHITGSILLGIEILLLGVVVDYICKNKERKNNIMLSVIAVVSIMFLFTLIYYLKHGNLFVYFLNINKSELINSVAYIFMGMTLAAIYEYNNRNIVYNIGIHACNNIIAICLALLFR